MLTHVLEKLEHINTGEWKGRGGEMCMRGGAWHHVRLDIRNVCQREYARRVLQLLLTPISHPPRSLDVLTQALKHDESLTRVALVMTEVLTRQLKLESWTERTRDGETDGTVAQTPLGEDGMAWHGMLRVM